MINSQLRELLEKYEQGTCSSEEEEILHSFFDSFQNSNDAWREIGIGKKEEIHSQIFDRIEQKTYEKERKYQAQRSIIWKVAASIVFVIGVGLSAGLYYTKPADEPIPYITRTALAGQKAVFRLPDGSTVHMNSGSSISYPESFGVLREVMLEGEAFFEVEENPDKAFIVKSDAVQTTVLGTSFNISAYPEEDNIKVTVATGRVSVTSTDMSYELQPGDQATYFKVDEAMTFTEVNIYPYLAWKDGILYFDGNTISEVVEELERWYGVSIEFEDDQQSHCDLKLTFEDLSLEQVLDQLEIVTGITYQFRDDSNVEIIGIGCIN